MLSQFYVKATDGILAGLDQYTRAYPSLVRDAKRLRTGVEENRQKYYDRILTPISSNIASLESALTNWRARVGSE